MPPEKVPLLGAVGDALTSLRSLEAETGRDGTRRPVTAAAAPLDAAPPDGLRQRPGDVAWLPHRKEPVGLWPSGRILGAV
mmetsp:Transcript_36789/g.80689  ORF Transcript_36789/g.80689 Transcript_36789/m.80689 type:complete len:80 (+) Transcript_36789:1017-1256(+)